MLKIKVKQKQNNQLSSPRALNNSETSRSSSSNSSSAANSPIGVGTGSGASNSSSSSSISDPRHMDAADTLMSLAHSANSTPTVESKPFVPTSIASAAASAQQATLKNTTSPTNIEIVKTNLYKGVT